ncbi:WbuC family cupin fold metalloprotein [Pseudodesulfovibrio piezophilus]|uniref:Cupin fold metalloprotein WbuC cupin domain-containing protein n=1 Tax=Pseudodesulfovibrio piezophilus (strain DSM 21447 / JCM 15486 / C1TLV30) TaxID=1322246 RepID=M1WM90_PSEP2|nr:WbuC family cupin fold metalloprotein [Pseudodesulfovibrio piezophilus]CCH49190.1 conserved protein of unknown function [Pseudodesulfovibrio piezophilus C1TLV30]
MTDQKNDFPTALAAPKSTVTPLTLTMVSGVLNQSRESPRKRLIQAVHKSDGAAVHKMFNAMQPGTYITPHRHMHPAKTETLLVMSGAMLFVQFSDTGELESHLLLQPGTEIFGVDVAPEVYHTFVALKPDTLVFEVKDGPFVADSDKDIPDWAPREGSAEAEPYLLDLLKELAERATAAAEAAAEVEKTEAKSQTQE